MFYFKKSHLLECKDENLDELQKACDNWKNEDSISVFQKPKDKKDEIELKISNNTSFIPKFMPNHEGTYRCQASKQCDDGTTDIENFTFTATIDTDAYETSKPLGDFKCIKGCIKKDDLGDYIIYTVRYTLI